MRDNDLLIAGIVGVGAVLLYGKTVNPSGSLLGSLFSGTGGLIFGNKAVTGGYGAEAGQKFWSTSIGSNLAGYIWGSASLNQPKVDSALSKSGWNANQVKEFISAYGANEALAAQYAINAGSVSGKLQSELSSVGWINPNPAPIVPDYTAKDYATGVYWNPV